MKCKITIQDQVNVKIEGLELTHRKALSKDWKVQIPYARYLPSVRLGRWDGCMNFFDLGGRTFVNLLDDIIPKLVDWGYDPELEDNRVNTFFEFTAVTEDINAEHKWPKGHVNAGESILLRDYQVSAVNAFLENPQCIQSISTGSGKTIITATLSKCCEPYGRTLVIVPNKDLVTQTEADYKLIGLDVGVFFGDRKELGHTHTIATWQSIDAVQRADDRQDELESFTDNLTAVIIDECHSVKGEILRKMLGGMFAHVPIRWGLTGTVPKEDFQSIILKTSIGNVVNTISAAELQERGVLANCHVNIVQFQDGLEFRSYPEELKYLTTNSKRLDSLAALIESIRQTGNTLILVDRIECGQGLVERLPGSVFINGDMKSRDRRDHYDEVAEVQDKTMVATYGVAAVGINVPRIFNLVLLEPGKSFVRVIQSIGRGIRRAQDKDHVNIWDITSSCKFSKRHLTKRKSYYREAEYPFTMEKKDL